MAIKYDDFFVRYDPSKESAAALTKKILYDCFINRRIKQNKPCKVGIFGASGEGKSFGTLRLQEILLTAQGLEASKYVDDINVFIPLEYPQKIDRLLGLNAGGFKTTGLKKINIIGVHEARELIKTSKWQSFISTATADVNELSREIKPMVFLIISQSIQDITREVRSTLTFYIKVHRPHRKKARLYIYVMWVDDTDIERPRLRKRKLSGCIVYPDGRYRRFTPKYLEVNKPKKETIEMFKRYDAEAKRKIIKSKLKRLMSEMSADMQLENNKVDAIVDFHIKNPETLNTIGRKRGKSWKLDKSVQEMYELTKQETVELQRKILEKFSQGENNGNNE